MTSDVPIRADSYATLEPLGITGVNYIQITAGTASKPLLKDTVPEGQIPRMASQRDALSDLLAGGGFVVQRTVEALDRVNRIFSDENIKTFGATLSDVQAVTAELRERKEIIADAQKTLNREINPTVYTAREFTGKLRGNFLKTVLGGKKLFLIGDEDDLRELGRQPVA